MPPPGWSMCPSGLGWKRWASGTPVRSFTAVSVSCARHCRHLINLRGTVSTLPSSVSPPRNVGSVCPAPQGGCLGWGVTPGVSTAAHVTVRATGEVLSALPAGPLCGLQAASAAGNLGEGGGASLRDKGQSAHRLPRKEDVRGPPAACPAPTQARPRGVSVLMLLRPAAPWAVKPFVSDPLSCLPPEPMKRQPET